MSLSYVGEDINMSRPKGAKNITPFKERKQIGTVSPKNVLHLVKSNKSPLENYHNLLRHEEYYLYWVNDMHDELQKTKSELAQLKKTEAKKGPKGPKEATFQKYGWYSKQLILLEAINGLEVFYKRTFIALGNLLREYISEEKVKGNIDAKVLWSLSGDVDVASLIFEPQLFHDYEKINEATKMLVGKFYYVENASKTKTLSAIFQIRHTLSHNGGLVTNSDNTKFRMLGFAIQPKEVIDPTAENLSLSIFRFLKEESQKFTDWLREQTIIFLKKRGGVPATKKGDLQKLLGGENKDWLGTIKWV